MRKNKILSVIGGLAAFIFTSCDGIFDVDYYTFLPEDYIFTNESTIEEGLLAALCSQVRSDAGSWMA